MSRPRFVTRLSLQFLFACLVGLNSRRAFAQTEDSLLHFVRGETTEDVVSGSDPTERYAVFLPSTYKPDRTAPVLFLMDPRGRATVPLKLFRDAADQFGFVLISSYNTLSDADSAFTADDKALSAMLIDAQARFAVDPKRFYLVGFSGTAHYAWTIAPQLDGHLAGIMGAGGGLPFYSEPIQRALKARYPFAFFATAGMADFNFDGVRYLDQALDSTNFPHRFVAHEGRHSWPPEHIAHDVVEWFHLQAMRAGLAPRNETFIDATRKKYLFEASALEASGRRADAYRRYREIIQDFEGLGGSPEAHKRFESLGRERSVGREFARRAEIARRVIKYQLKVRNFCLDYRKAKNIPTLEKARGKLHIEKLKKRAESQDREEAAAAQRMLATAFVNAGFYEPRDYFAKEDFRRAAGMLRIAMAIWPGVPHVCYQLARATAQLGEADEAFKALDCGLKADWATKELVESDSLLEPLRADPRLKIMIEGLIQK